MTMNARHRMVICAATNGQAARIARLGLANTENSIGERKLLLGYCTQIDRDYFFAGNSHLTDAAKGKALDELVNSRLVRSAYSEEFMSSSEERERGLQFYGGASAGSVSSRHRIAPYFDTEALESNVTISEGSAFVHLPCRVKQLGDRTVSSLYGLLLRPTLILISHIFLHFPFTV